MADLAFHSQHAQATAAIIQFTYKECEVGSVCNEVEGEDDGEDTGAWWATFDAAISVSGSFCVSVAVFVECGYSKCVEQDADKDVVESPAGVCAKESTDSAFHVY